MRRDTKIVGACLAAAASLVLTASALCSWAVAHGASPRWRLVFRALCHGIERRCLTLDGVPMPLCARCTAIYLGLLSGVIFFFLLPRIEERASRIILFLAALPMAVDGLTQALGLRESTNELRMATGLIAAIPFALWALTAVERGPAEASEAP